MIMIHTETNEVKVQLSDYIETIHTQPVSDRMNEKYTCLCFIERR